MTTAVRFLSNLGFIIKHSKSVGPTREADILGIVVNTSDQSFSLTKEKREKAIRILRTAIGEKFLFMNDIQKLGGFLNHISFCVSGMEPFMEYIWQALRITHARRRDGVFEGFKINKHFIKQLTWIITRLQSHIPCKRFATPHTQHIVEINTDAASTIGWGGWTHTGHFGGGLWPAEFMHAHINIKEFIIALAFVRITCSPGISHAHVYTDNTVTISAFTKLRSKNPIINVLLKTLTTIDFVQQVVTIEHVAGKRNSFPDALSREKTGLVKFCRNPNLIQCLDFVYDAFYPSMACNFTLKFVQTVRVLKRVSVNLCCSLPPLFRFLLASWLPAEFVRFDISSTVILG